MVTIRVRPICLVLASLVPSSARSCSSARQRQLLQEALPRIRASVDSDDPAVQVSRCKGDNQQTCTVSTPRARKACARRTCPRSALEQLLPDFGPELTLEDAGKTVQQLLGARGPLEHRFSDPTHHVTLNVGPVRFTGGDYLDFIVYNMLFRGKRNGVFVEAGAIDGVQESNTFALEHFLGWTGLLIEPSKCAQCATPHYRPRSTTFQGAICKAGENVTWTPSPHTLGGNFETACSRNSTADPRLLECYRTTRFRKRMPCMSLTYILQSHGMERIDLFSLDVEGFVSVALRSLDFGAIDVSALLVEAHHPKDVEYLRAQNYTTLPLTSIKDEMRGYYGDYLAWKPERFESICQQFGR